MKYLPKKVHEKGLTFDQFKDQLGISRRTAQVYLHKGIVPPFNRYRSIASVLDLTYEEVFEGFKRQLIAEGKEKICKECGELFIGYKTGQSYCKEECKINGYKKNKQGINRRMKSTEDLTWRSNPLELKIISVKSELKRDELDEKVSEYLLNGNQITFLPDGPNPLSFTACPQDLRNLFIDSTL